MEPPDGGYGWVIVACSFMLSAVTWGNNTTFGIFLCFYRQNAFFPGATDIHFAFIGGLSVSISMICAPFVNYLSKRFNFKVPLVMGLLFLVTSQIFAGLSTRIWALFLTQGVLFGMGLGFLWIPAFPLTNQWFSKRRALAGGVFAAGSGAGALTLSLTTQVIIQRLGLKWAFFINALISLVILVPVIFLLKSRVRIIQAKFEPIQYQLLSHPGFLYVWLWGFFINLGYILALYTLATYSTSGLGFTQAQGSSLQAILAVGQIVGRPIAGTVMDRFGRINVAAIITFISGLSCLVIWMFSTTYGLLAFFAVVQGMFGGIFWGASGPITTEIVGLTGLGSALSILWLTVAIPCTFAEPIAVWLLHYSQNHLHRSGADAFRSSIGFAGASFIVASLVLLGAKRWKQKNWKVFVKT
ncbi:major facilitator superfamily domain-containing protein [Gautieria morchelliformis]|nr:major facilitator superfamily domain-containing protein [Gautieria morchelliformis]KAF8483042.1 major facilitator superfamily domain-containing protein [Gautieria morchelliformis]